MPKVLKRDEAKRGLDVVIDTDLSIGDLAIVGSVLFTGTANYIAIMYKVKATDWKVEELRRGRGLILKDWPPRVQACFGWINGNGKHSGDRA